MEMSIVKVPYPIKDSYYEDSDIRLSEVERLRKDINLFVYTYAMGSYEGTGFAIVRFKDGKWDTFHLGHCSCYGPTDHIKRDDSTAVSWRGLLKVEKNFSEESRRELGPVLATVKEIRRQEARRKKSRAKGGVKQC